MVVMATSERDTKVKVLDLGLTVLSEGERPVADVVFVHGLQGHPKETWACREAASEAPAESGDDQPFWRRVKTKSRGNQPMMARTQKGNQIFWPEDFLPSDCPSARILTWGYDSKVTKLFSGPANQNSFLGHAQNLLLDLDYDRRHHSTRPLIFVAHSLGGIIVKEVLRRSRGSEFDPALQNIYNSTIAVIFLGTPHRGSQIAPWGIIAKHIVAAVGFDTNARILRDLDMVSSALEFSKEEFSKILKLGTFQVCTFQEALGMKGMRGLNGKVVDEFSSSLDDASERKATINANHMAMCQFSNKDDDGYRKVSREICRAVYRYRQKVGKQQLHSQQEISPAILGTVNSLVTLSRDDLEQRAAKHKLHINKGSAHWFNSRPEYRTWCTSKSCQFLWYARVLDSGTASVMLYQLQRLLSHANVYTQDLTYFFCSPFILIPGETEKRRLTSNLLLCFIIAQLLHSDYNRRSYDRFKLISPGQERELLTSITSADLASEDSLFELFKDLMSAKPDREIRIVIDSIDSLPEKESICFLQRLRHLWNAMMEGTKVIMKILVTSHWAEDIQGILKNLPCIDQDAEASECLTSLSLNAYNVRETNASEGQDDTGDWIRKSPVYEDWDVTNRSSILWIQGKPGSGKSTLLKRILKKLQIEHGVKGQAEVFHDSSTPGHSGAACSINLRAQANADARENKTIIAAFFYNRRGGQTETGHAQMLQSLLFQVLQQDVKLFTSFRETYRRLRDNTGNTIRWSFEDLKAIFLVILKLPLRAYLIIDALDESDEAERDEILSLLPNDCSETTSKVKSIVASRPSLDIKRILEDVKDCHKIVVENENLDDIRKVVDAGLAPVVKTLDPCSSEFRLVHSYLTNNSHGVFLWVELVIRKVEQYVRAGATSEGIMRRLKDTPEDLYPFYADIVRQLKARDVYDIAEANDMLAWASSAARPLNLLEFGDAIAVSAISDLEPLDGCILGKKRYLNPENLRKGIENRSGGLLEITTPRTVSRERYSNYHSKDYSRDLADIEIVQLLHQTVKDFLLTEENAAPFTGYVAQGDRLIIKASVRYLELSLSPASFPEGVAKEVERWELKDYERFVNYLADRPLLNYVLSCLPHHFESLGESPAQESLIRFLQRIQEQPQLYSWCFLALWSVEHGYTSTPIQQVASGRSFVNSTLVTAVRLGLTGVVTLTIAAGSAVNDFDEKNAASPLLAAAKFGRCDVAQILIENGASLDLSWGLHGAALHAAIAAGDINMVRFLLTRGASIGTRDSDESSALTAAARTENHEILMLLTEMGADISARDERGWTALHRVVNEEKIATVELLLASGVPPNALTNDGLTALHLAVAKQDENMVGVLLDQGQIDPDVMDKAGQTPLSRAVVYGQMKIIKLMLNQVRVNPNAANGDGQTALHLAVAKRDDDMVAALLQHERINPNVTDASGRTPLLMASESGYKAAALLLLGRGGVDPNFRDKYDKTPLLKAAQNGHKPIVQILLKRDDVDSSSQDKDGRTALSWAAEGGHESVVQLMLERINIDTETRDKNSRTPLWWAAERGHKAVAQLLLERGNVSPNSKDRDGRTALSCAAEGGHKSLVQLLLEQDGVDPDSQDGDGRTPLWWAAENGHEAVVELLLERDDVTPDPKDTDNRTALCCAAENGHETVVRIFLERDDVQPGFEDKHNRSPLWWAAENGHDGIVRLLLKCHNVSVGSRDERGMTPMWCAKQHGHEAVLWLLKRAVLERWFRAVRIISIITWWRKRTQM
ncbi:MAG: hypothetical protein M1813_009623 [Trichoglossum hirsutum]|nr:MAG: hypothetical protein M1813_009623 [Trichoglossum hirsutum]